MTELRWIICAAALGLSACATPDGFRPKSDYPPDPWVKGYSDPQECLDGEKLAARQFALPDYPKKAFRTGRQGWVILKLDVDGQGLTRNVDIERAVPEGGLWGGFEDASLRAARAWRFDPPGAPLTECRVLIRYRMGSVSLGS